MAYSLLFDIGNVIVAFDFQITVRKIAGQCSIAPEKIFATVNQLKDELELGEISPEEFLDRSIQLIGYTGEKDYLKAAFQDVFELNLPMVDLIEREAKQGTPLYLLSNTNGIHVPYLFDEFSVFHRFEGAIYSHEVGLMKPDPKIYEVTASRLKLDPGMTIYIDDLPENVEAGAEFGFESICYDKSSHESFLEAFYERTKVCGRV